MTTYEHIKFGGPVLQDILSTLLARMFSSVKVKYESKVSESNMKVKAFSNSFKKTSRSKFQLPDHIKFLKKELNNCH